MLGLVARAAAGAPVREQAKQHYEEGAKAYRLGDFARAAEEYRQSYELFPAPLLLYNLGQAHRELGALEKAVHFYKQYLADDPKRELGREAEQYVAELEKRIEERRRAAERKAEPPPPALAPVVAKEPPSAPPPAAPPAQVDRPSPRPALVAGIALAALAVGGAITGGVLVAHASSLDDQAMQATSLDGRTQLYASAGDYRPAGFALIGVAGAAAVGAVVALVVWSRRAHHMAQRDTSFAFLR